MALRGLDAQILMTKAAELTGEHARAIKQSEKQTEQAALQAQRQIQSDLKRTQATGKIKGSRVDPDKQGNGNAYADPPKGEKQEESQPPNEGSDLLLLPVVREEHRIDIMI